MRMYINIDSSVFFSGNKPSPSILVFNLIFTFFSPPRCFSFFSCISALFASYNIVAIVSTSGPKHWAKRERKMEAREIDYIKSNIYIPPLPKQEVPRLPVSHPSLIIPDQTADLSKRASCGCCKGDRCIKESASWLYGPNGEVRTVHRGENSSQETLFYNLSNESTGRQL